MRLSANHYNLAAAGLEGRQSLLVQTTITAIGPNPIQVEILGPTLTKKDGTFLFLSGFLAFLMVVSKSR